MRETDLRIVNLGDHRVRQDNGHAFAASDRMNTTRRTYLELQGYYLALLLRVTHLKKMRAAR